MSRTRESQLRLRRHLRIGLTLLLTLVAPIALATTAILVLTPEDERTGVAPQLCNSCQPPGEDFCVPEVCDGADNDCDGLIDEGVLRTYYRDADGDGKGAGPALQGCTVPTGYVTNNADCNDANATVWQVGRYFQDLDGDGYGNPSKPKDACGRPVGYVTDATDCNDTNASVRPGATKACGTGACAVSVQACINGAEQTCTPKPPTAEICDRIDNDCNGQVDDLQPISCGMGVCARTVPACATMCTMEEPRDGKPPVQVCEWGDNVCTPGSPTAESCNGKDDDCDGMVDDGVLLTLYRDGDSDGYGAGASLGTSCTVLAGQSSNNQDCNDASAAVKPGAVKTCGTGACVATVQACVNGVEQTCTPKPATEEVCDRIDNDCNGQVDDLPPLSCGVGACARTAPVCALHCWLEATQQDKPPREVCEWGAYGICTPGTPSPEVCNNNIDEDCTGWADDSKDPNAWLTFYVDQDHDGYGASWEPRRACRQPDGTRPLAGDCDDTRADMRPGAPELCDGLDNNCSGTPDESDVCQQITCQ